jgi:hypothetical protein
MNNLKRCTVSNLLLANCSFLKKFCLAKFDGVLPDDFLRNNKFIEALDFFACSFLLNIDKLIAFCPNLRKLDISFFNGFFGFLGNCGKLEKLVVKYSHFNEQNSKFLFGCENLTHLIFD